MLTVAILAQVGEPGLSNYSSVLGNLELSIKKYSLVKFSHVHFNSISNSKFQIQLSQVTRSNLIQ